MSNHEQDIQDTAKEAEQIIADKVDVRVRIRELTMNAIKTGEFSLSRLGEVADTILRGALGGIQELSDEKTSKEVFGQVYDGLNDALILAMDASNHALHFAAEKGKAVSEAELEKVKETLQGMETKLSESMSVLARNSEEQLAEPVRTMVGELQSQASRIAPHAAEILGALKDKPLETAAITTSSLLQSIGGFLEATGDLIQEAKDKPAATKEPEEKSAEYYSSATGIKEEE